MTRTYTNDLFIRAAAGESTPRPPIWMMRQAGRTDPEYLRLKAEANMPLEDMFRNPELAARLSLLPKRIGVDAIIYFQDILTPLAPMGAEFVFAPGPKLEEPIRSAEQVEAFHPYDVADELPFIPETFRLIYEALDGEMPALGFAGAPLTLAVFMIEGGTFGERADTALAFLREQPEALRRLLDTLTTMVIDCLKLQIEAGAAAVQLFESAAHLLSPAIYREFALPYHQRIFDALKGLAPTIMFAREWGDVGLLDASGADILSLPSSVSIAGAREIVGKDRVVQGNLDNRLLAEGTLDEVTHAANACIESGQRRGHIFNLSHGLLRQTPFENVCHLVKIVRESA
jgi:uroporphyrinogen decarboxylase